MTKRFRGRRGRTALDISDDFCVVGDGICVGPDGASPVTTAHEAPFRFKGGTIDKVVDVSGERYVDHEAQVRTWFWDRLTGH